MRQIKRQVQPTAIELANRLTDEATSPRGVLYDVPLGHAQVQAAGCGIGRDEIHAALEEIRRRGG